MKKKRSRLTIKMIMGFLILGVLVSAASSGIGFVQYKQNIEKQYNTTAYQVAEVVHSHLDDTLLKQYADVAMKYNRGDADEADINAIVESSAYKEAHLAMNRLRKGMEANDIFVVLVDQEEMLRFDESWNDEQMKEWKPTIYLFDNYSVEEESFPFAYAARFNPKFIEDTVAMWQTGKRSDNYFISESEFGYNTSAMLPVTVDGEVVAAIGVEVPMVTITSNLRNYLLSAIIITTLVELLLITIYVIYIYRTVVRPINAVSKEANEFIKNESRVSETLASIKTGDEIENLAESIRRMEVDINDYIDNLTAVTAEKERIGAELDVAKNIQASMLPCIFPAFPDRKELDIYATMTPAKEVGGDFYDFFMVDDRHIAIVMADVSGKGVPAALFMVIGKTLIKDHTYLNRDLGEVFSEVNDLLCEANSQGLFITAFEGVLDLLTGEFTFVNAGHEMPFIYRKGEGYAPYKIKPGFVLAGMEGMKYRGGSLQMNLGDKIFQYTDGVTEATDKNEQLFGMDRLQAVLDRCGEMDPQKTLETVKADIDAFVGDAPQFDDITMLCLEYREKYEEK